MKVPSAPLPSGYVFGPYRLDLQRQELRRGDEPVPLTPKAFDTLRVLVEAEGAVVPKEELLALVWRDRFVEESVLSQNVYTLRKVLAEGDEGRTYILTVPRRGYRFAVAVERLSGEHPLPVLPVPPDAASTAAAAHTPASAAAIPAPASGEVPVPHVTAVTGSGAAGVAHSGGDPWTGPERRASPRPAAAPARHRPLLLAAL